MSYNPSTKNDSIRNISTIISYPPGSIYELPEKTVMILGPDYWEKEKSNLPYKVIEDQRLSNFLGVDGFREPPGLDLFDSDEETYYNIPARIFPDIQICLTCSRLYSYYKTKKILENKLDDVKFQLKKFNYQNPKNKELKLFLPGYVACPFCSLVDSQDWKYTTNDFEKKIRNISDFLSKSISLRWIYICEGGHTNDIPLGYVIAHREGCEKENYEFQISKGSYDLSQQFIKCLDCSQKISIQDISRKIDHINNRVIAIKCQGSTFWKKDTNISGNGCDEKVVVAQKGDSMVCMPNVITSIQIPPYNFYDEISKLINTLEIESYMNKMKEEYGQLKSIATNSIQTDLKIDEIIEYIYIKLVGKSNLDKDDVRELLKLYVYKRFNISIDTLSESETEKKEYRYRHKEFSFLINGKNLDHHNIKRIISTRSQIDKEELRESYFRDIIIADQLTITMTLKTISRVNSKVYDNEDAVEIPIKSPSTTWLPAVEIKGEGIFIDFKNDLLDKWYNANSKHFEKVYDEKFQKESSIYFNTPSGFAKFLFLHSFSHYFINAMSFVCGYNSASLRERIYFSEDAAHKMNATLIMTSAGDSESSLGGLAYYGQIEQFLHIFKNTIDKLKICSNDPICGEQKPHDKKIIYAACYSCLLLPETSCEFNNNYLDRNCLVGDGDGINSVKGFFVLNEK
jgi:translation initiation factor 2 beta subunit (eIF-2beta)/eIF-5